MYFEYKVLQFKYNYVTREANNMKNIYIFVTKIIYNTIIYYASQFVS